MLELYALFDKVVEKHSESEKTKKESTDSLCEGFVQLVHTHTHTHHRTRTRTTAHAHTHTT